MDNIVVSGNQVNNTSTLLCDLISLEIDRADDNELILQKSFTFKGMYAGIYS